MRGGWENCTLLIFQLRKSRFSFVARHETRSLAVHEWNSSKSWISIWIFNSHEDWWKTHSCFSIFMRLFLLDFLCRPFEQFPHGCKEKSHISDWDFHYNPIYIKLNGCFRKYLDRIHIWSVMEKKVSGSASVIRTELWLISSVIEKKGTESAEYYPSLVGEENTPWMQESNPWPVFKHG